MVKGVYALEVDWNNDGDFADTGEDVTARLLRVEYTRGRDYASQLTGRSTSGRLTALLNNASGDYNSFNSSSPLFGNILPGRKVRLLGGQWGLDMDGSGDYVDVGNITQITDATATMTVEFWLRVATMQYQSVVCRLSGGGDAQFSVDVYANGAVAFLHAGAERGRTAAGVITVNTWHHVAVVFNGGGAGNDDKVKIYVDGVDKGPLTFDNAPQTTLTTVSALSVLFGRRNSGTLFEYDGELDEVRIWSSARSASQVADNRHSKLTGSESGLVGYWRMAEGTGSTTADTTANGYTGTITGATWRRTFRASCYAETAQWSGFLHRLLPEPSIRGGNRATLEAIGPLGYLNQRKVHVPMQTNRLTGAAIGDVLDAAGWPAADRAIDTGQTTMARFWVEEMNTIPALRKVEDTESAFLRESPDGKVVFEDRQHRTASPHTVSQATFSDAAGAARVYSEVYQEDPLPNVFNVLEAEVARFTVGALAVLWTLPETGANSPLLSPGESRTFWAQYPTPDATGAAVGVDAWTTPAAATDYNANSQSGGGGTDLTASIGVAVTKYGESMKIVLTNNHATTAAYITLLQARGTPVTKDDPIRVSAEDATSKTRYGERTYPSPGEFIPDSGEAQDFCDYNLNFYKDASPVLAIRVDANRDATHMEEAMARDISDRVTIVAQNNAGLGINEDFFVETMHHTITDAGHYHTVRYDLSPAANLSDLWVLGVSELGVNTRLGY